MVCIGWNGLKLENSQNVGTRTLPFGLSSLAFLSLCPHSLLILFASFLS